VGDNATAAPLRQAIDRLMAFDDGELLLAKACIRRQEEGV